MRSEACRLCVTTVALALAWGGVTGCTCVKGSSADGDGSAASAVPAGFTCDGLTSCPGDPRPDLARCRLQTEGKCGAEGKAALWCMQTNQVCAADGRTDYQATSLHCTHPWQEFYGCIGAPASGPPGSPGARRAR